MESPIEQSPEHVHLLGVIAARWATLDLTLARLVGMAVDDDQMGEDIYFSSSAQRLRFDLLKAVIPNTQWDEADKTTLLKAVLALEKLWAKRNDIMHNPAIARPTKDGGFQYAAKMIKPIRKNRVQEVSLSLKHLEEHAEAVSQAGGVVWDFVWRDAIALLKEQSGKPQSSS